ncbi:MAG TPA: hypothetical protein VH478_05905 [Trebonia sp.]|nr:hypothetical protein [Trebonia sp.]
MSSFSRTWRVTARCSVTRSPTCGLSARTGMPSGRRTSGRPMPDRSSSSGVSTVPAQTITSRRARTSAARPPRSTRTPVTRVPSSSSRTARVRVATVTPRRPRANAR